MKIDVKRDDLLQSLQSVIGVVERKQTMPILANVLINIKPDHYSVTATDLEVELISYVHSDNEGEFSFTAPGRKLLDICRALPGNSSILIESKDNKIQVSSGKSKFNLATLPENEFPLTKDIQSNNEISIKQDRLKQIIDKTHFSMAQQDVRYYLNGLLIELESNKIRAVATDGHRLALSSSTTADENEGGTQVILPRKGVMELQRLLDGQNEIKVTLGDNHIQVKFETVSFTSKLIDGKFPEYGRVIPSNTENKLKANKNDLKVALSRAAILSNEKYRGIRLIIKTNELTIQAHNPEQEKAEESIAIEYEGNDIEIGFNVTYLIDALNVVGSDEVILSVVDNNSSCLISDPEDETSKFVIMPMRL
jgi:DNA polymerase-3 subunit beta